MSDTMNLNVRIGGTLKDYVNHAIQVGGYDNNSEYVRDLIRREKEREEQAMFKAKKTALQHAFSAPDDQYVTISAEDIIKRNAHRHKK